MKVRGSNGIVVDVPDAVATAMAAAGHVELVLDPTEAPALTQLLDSEGEGGPQGGGDNPAGAAVAGDKLTFDPAQFKVDEVLNYLANIDDTDPEAHDAEVARVLEAEKAGKNRKSLTEAIEGTPETQE